MTSHTPLHCAALCVFALCAAPAVAYAHQAAPRFPVQRPTYELSPWIGVGGGAVVGPGLAPAVFDLRLGGDFTGAIDREGDLRLGPFLETSSSSFASFTAVGGIELFVGAVPRPLRMFLYSGEGVLLARLGAGWQVRSRDLPGMSSTPVASLTLAYGYRAPFSLREYRDETTPEPSERATARYMTGARLWINTTVDLNDTPAWQLTGGIEFEPVGSFRYLLGLY